MLASDQVVDRHSVNLERDERRLADFGSPEVFLLTGTGITPLHIFDSMQAST